MRAPKIIKKSTVFFLLCIILIAEKVNSYAYVVNTTETHSGGTFSCSSLDVQAGGYLYITSGCNFTVTSGNITVRNGGTICLNNGSTFTAHGDITIDKGGTIYALGGSGNVINQDHKIIINGKMSLFNSCTLNFSGGQININPGGSLILGDNGTINMNNVHSFIDVRANYATTPPAMNLPGGRLSVSYSVIQGGNDNASMPGSFGFLGINVWGGTGKNWPGAYIDGVLMTGQPSVNLNQNDPRCAKAILDHSSVLYARTALANCAWEGEPSTWPGVTVGCSCGTYLYSRCSR